MFEAEIVGTIVIGLSAIVGLFLSIYKPLSDNTKAMTTLTLNIKQLANKVDEQNKRIEKQENNLLRYKEHVSESQRRQWDALDEHDRQILKLEHNLKLCQSENKKGGNEDV